MASIKMSADGYLVNYAELVRFEFAPGKWIRLSDVFDYKDLLTRLAPYTTVFQNIEISKATISYGDEGKLFIYSEATMDVLDDEVKVTEPVGNKTILLPNTKNPVTYENTMLPLTDFMDSLNKKNGPAVMQMSANTTIYTVGIEMTLRLKDINPGIGVPNLTHVKNPQIDTLQLQQINVLKALQRFESTQDLNLSNLLKGAKKGK
jgi:hypothetical protein